MKRTRFHVAACLAAMCVSSAWSRTPLFLDKSVESWQEQLGDSDAKARRGAAFALGRVGEDARPAVSKLVRLVLDDDDPGVRDMAASAIGDITRALKGDAGDVWREASGTLVKALKADTNAHVRRSAAYALGAFGPPGVAAAPHLRKALSDKNTAVRQNAAWALGQIGEGASEAVGPLCECLRDADVLVRRDAAGALGSMGKYATTAVSPLIRLVKSEPDEVVKKTALDSLAHVATPEDAKYAKELTPLLADRDAEIRLGSAIVLARIGGPDAADAVPVLRKALKDSDPAVPLKAAAALAMPTLGSTAAPAMYDLAECLNNPKHSALVRGYAALAIAHIGPKAKPVVPSLAKALREDQPPEVRHYASEALGQMKWPAIEKALPTILEIIAKDNDRLVRQKCVWSLFPMSREDMAKTGADKALTKVVAEPPGEMNLPRYDAARKLAATLNADAPDKVADVLLEMLQNKMLHVYNSTDAKVSGAGTEASAAQVNVKENLGGDARFMAVEALSFLGKKAKARKDVMDALKEASKDKDAELSKAAKKALKDLEG